MWRYLIGRLAAMVPLLLIVSILVFLMIHLIPGDPVRVMMAQSGASAEAIDRVRTEMGLNDPLPVQYGHFLKQMLTGEVRSIRTRQPVIQQFFRLFPGTLQVAAASLVLAVLFGVAIGTVAAVRQHTWVDNIAMAISFLGVSMPNFWLSLLLMFAFAQHLGWLPATGGGTWRHLVLPAVVLAVEQTALMARLVRANMVEILREEYVKTARAKGLSAWTVVMRHAMRNALIPLVTLIGLNFGYLLSGTVVVETVFARPGVGRMIVDGILSKDFPVVQGAVLLTACFYLLVNLTTDLSYALIDPRIKYEG